jgi:hypothetical protein
MWRTSSLYITAYLGGRCGNTHIVDHRRIIGIVGVAYNFIMVPEINSLPINLGALEGSAKAGPPLQLPGFTLF